MRHSWNRKRHKSSVSRARHCSSQHLENDSCGPAEYEHAVHRRYRSNQPPAADGNDVAISKRRKIHKGKINRIGTCRRGTDDCIGEGPKGDLGRMRRHQDRYGHNHDGGQMPPSTEIVPGGYELHDVDNRRHHQRMNHYVADADGKTHEKLAQHRSAFPVFSRADRVLIAILLWVKRAMEFPSPGHGACSSGHESRPAAPPADRRESGGPGRGR